MRPIVQGKTMHTACTPKHTHTQICYKQVRSEFISSLLAFLSPGVWSIGYVRHPHPAKKQLNQRIFASTATTVYDS